MKKVFLFFLLCAFFVTPPLFARHFFNEEQELGTKKIVIELSLKNQGHIPPLTLFYNGYTTQSDSTGFAKFPAPKQLPKKWYFLLTQNCVPVLSKTKQITAFTIAPQKKYAYYSCKWDEAKEEWSIKTKNLQLKKNTLSLEKAKDTIIIALSPSFSSAVQPPTCSRPHAETGAVILLPQIVLEESKGNKKIDQTITKSLLPQTLHSFNKKIIEKKISNTEGKTSLTASYI